MLDPLLETIRSCTKLEELDVSHNHQLAMSSLAGQYPRLRVLNMSHAAEVEQLNYSHTSTSCHFFQIGEVIRFLQDAALPRLQRLFMIGSAVCNLHLKSMREACHRFASLQQLEFSHQQLSEKVGSIYSF